MTTPYDPIIVDDYLAFLDEIIQDMFIKWKWLSAYLDTLLENDNPDTKTLMRVLRIYTQIIGRFGRILRDRKALAPPASDALQEVLNQAMNELSEEWGLQL